MQILSGTVIIKVKRGIVMSDNEIKNIVFFGTKNSGKSSLLNSFSGRKESAVSENGGTTTEKIEALIEMPGVGKVRIIDTPGCDDEGEMSAANQADIWRILDETDVAVLVCDAMGSLKQTMAETQLKDMFRDKEVPFIVAQNKIDLIPAHVQTIIASELSDNEVLVSSVKKESIDELKKKIISLLPGKKESFYELNKGDEICIVISNSAPSDICGEDYQMIIKDALEHGCNIKILNLSELMKYMSAGILPKYVITGISCLISAEDVVANRVPVLSVVKIMSDYFKKDERGNNRNGINARSQFTTSFHAI